MTEWQGYRCEVFDADGVTPRLLWHRPQRSTLERRLDRGQVDELIASVAGRYAAVGSAGEAADLGGVLYRWLDGPSERWLAGARGQAEPMVVAIDAVERLRGLPWELWHDGGFLAVDPVRPVTPVRVSSPRQRPMGALANRPLRVLFMAFSPVGVEPVLDFEGEEGVILEAARGLLEITVEESGSLQGLTERLEWFGPGYFDVLHLSGHGHVTPSGPRLVMEAPDGSAVDVSADELAAAIGGAWPRLVFVSGCYTAAPGDGQGLVASMAEDLVDHGASTVLGWALPVGDVAASKLASDVYRGLATGRPIPQAVTKARSSLYTDRNGNWHLLRLYADRSPQSPMVTAPGTKGRARVHYQQASTLFLDPDGKVKVADRSAFVGRRRELQQLLRELRPADSTTGPQVALIHGMGGLGKSTLTARVLDRTSDTHPQHAVWVGTVDAAAIQRSLTTLLGLNNLDLETKINQILNTPGISLTDQLRYVLAGPLADIGCLFVFDDFEQGNLETDGQGGHLPTPAAAEVLTGFAQAIRATSSPSRVIVTSRYAFPTPPGVSVAALPISQLDGADLTKKLRQTHNLHPDSQLDPAIRARAVIAAAGIPRLIERLDALLDSTSIADVATTLTAVEQAELDYREDLLLHTLLQACPPPARHALALAATYEIPVPREAITALTDHADSHAELQAGMEHAIRVGLLQAGLHPATGEQRYLVSGLVRPLLADTGEALTGEQLRRAQETAAWFLFRRWVQPDAQ